MVTLVLLALVGIAVVPALFALARVLLSFKTVRGLVGLAGLAGLYWLHIQDSQPAAMAQVSGGGPTPAATDYGKTLHDWFPLAAMAALLIVLIAADWFYARRQLRKQQFRPVIQPAPAPAIPSPAAVAPTHGAILASDVNRDMLLRYRDSSGATQDRLVTIQQLIGGQNADGTITIDRIAAYCHLRKGPRTFRLDRMLHVANAETGEVAKDTPAFIGALCGRRERAHG